MGLTSLKCSELLNTNYMAFSVRKCMYRGGKKKDVATKSLTYSFFSLNVFNAKKMHSACSTFKLVKSIRRLNPNCNN